MNIGKYLILVAGVAALGACGGNSDSEANNMVDANLMMADESGGSMDVNMTGTDMNAGLGTDINGGMGAGTGTNSTDMGTNDSSVGINPDNGGVANDSGSGPAGNGQ